MCDNYVNTRYTTVPHQLIYTHHIDQYGTSKLKHNFWVKENFLEVII